MKLSEKADCFFAKIVDNSPASSGKDHQDEEGAVDPDYQNIQPFPHIHDHKVSSSLRSGTRDQKKAHQREFGEHKIIEGSRKSTLQRQELLRSIIFLSESNLIRG